LVFGYKRNPSEKPETAMAEGTIRQRAWWSQQRARQRITKEPNPPRPTTTSSRGGGIYFLGGERTEPTKTRTKT